MLQALRDNPRRAPNWRWLRAVQIDTGGPRATRAVDGEAGFAWIRRASRMKRRYEKAGNRPDALYRLIQYDRDMFWAHSMWLDEKSPMRWAIEACVLAGMTSQQIAAKIGTNAEIIEAYENVFFDVRDRLNDKLYVVNVVMADAVTRGISERQYDLLWKLFGYQGGPYVLESVISKCSPIAKPEKPEDVGQFFQDFAVNTVKHKAAVATLTVPINTHTQLAIIDSFVQYVQIEKNSENAGKAQSTIVENIGAMLGALPFRIGTKLESAAEKMLPYDDGAAELRNDELMIVAAGGKLTDQKLIQDLRFPGE
jgi:hypothetical protein